MSIKTKHMFEWDNHKELENIRKHGVSFVQAKEAFDEKHSDSEPRMFCIGNIGTGIVTVRFLYKDEVIRIFGAGYWRKGRKLYEKENNK